MERNNKICHYCDEELGPTNQEKYHKDRDEYYCERCEEMYFEEIEEA